MPPRSVPRGGSDPEVMEFSIDLFCEQTGLDSPVLVHTGSSRVWRAESKDGRVLAVRVTDSGRNPATLADADIVRAASGLVAAGCPVVTPASSQVVHIGSCAVTLWSWVDAGKDAHHRLGDWRFLGTGLRMVHSTDSGLELAPLEELLATRLTTRLAIITERQPEWVDDDQLATLTSVTAELLPLLPAAAAGTETVHGDFHHGNVIWSQPPVISDLEGLSRGSGAYDVAVLTERVRCYGLETALVDELVLGYGDDVRGDPGFEVLVRAKQMISTQWCAVQAMRWPDLQEEAIKRLQWWRHGDGPAWKTNPGAK